MTEAVERFECFGSTCSVLVMGNGRSRTAEQSARLVRRRLLGWHRRFSRFEPDSELSRFNAGAGRWLDVSVELEGMLRAALDAYERSGGLVHVGVLGSLLAIGYTRPLRQGPTRPRLAAARPPPPLPDMLEVRAGRARLSAGTGVDLGGLAKGWLADRLSDRLGDNCLVNLGGDLYARGEGPGGGGWAVGFGGVTVMLRDQGAATSSTRCRSWISVDTGERHHHLIDPRTGAPSRSDLTEVSVVAADATTAEVVAKTALLLGSAPAPAFLAAHAAAWYLGE
jgi:thiamine biosynthesis lipoprotein